MTNCIFCRIVNKEISSDIVLESDAFVAFKDINPKARHHVLVVPKKHIESLNQVGELTEDELKQLLVFAADVARKLGIQDSGYRLVANNGPDAGQEVAHLHFHILGGEKLGGFW